jgi:hypothetical protein
MTVFFGRNKELAEIKTAFTQNNKRSFTISGIDGQGKTYLATKAGKDLEKLGLFKKVYLVDYAAFYGIDSLGFTIRKLANLLGKDLENAVDALQNVPTLLILDHLERVPAEPLQELLNAVKNWSEQGNCWVLLTTSNTDLVHPDYPNNEYLRLSGLTKEDAISAIEHLLNLELTDDKRAEFIELFKLVNFHPLSMRILAVALKEHNPIELKKLLATKMLETPDNILWAVLSVSLKNLTVDIQKTGLLYWLAKRQHWKTTQRKILTAEIQASLPILGVFQGGTFQPEIIYLTPLQENQWVILRTALELMGLIELRYLQDFKVPYIKFHPSLAPALWRRLSSEDQDKLSFLYQHRYAELVGYLYHEEGESTDHVRNLVRWNLPNLFHAVYGALESNRKGADLFATNLDLFLTIFVLKRDSDELNKRIKAGTLIS